ncbi:cold-shock protein [Mesorhizobium sp. YM1C-6-2]|uniref:cold-shock protein n=1 Tax=Mesorhizobium sp. YM1C-6-2 TaxID=1827501 RepID=UPI000EF2373C|nr:cold-shock protein [Mesorhizobium sp. YM1C-6-2]RLP22750.1 cold-shock protein [Mesorhizobium sp. YM1C-6-2]
MGRYRDHRQPRSQGFESDNHIETSEPSYFDRRPARQAASSASKSPACDAEVLWFNAEKGFGFLKLSDGSDAFIHLSKLQAAGHDSLPEGARLQVLTEPGQKGPQVVEVVSVLGDGAFSPSVAKQSAEAPDPAPDLDEQETTGVVKRYDLTKGFGFIALDGGGKDVFVHATTLARSGVSNLEVGQNVIITYSRSHKGLEARTIRLR